MLTLVLIGVIIDYMNLKYRYRIYPTTEQEERFRQIAGSNRYVWNHFLDLEMQEYSSTKKFKFYSNNAKDLTKLKKTYEWLKATPSTSLQQTLIYLERALKQSFGKNGKTKKGFPKFKKRKNFDASFSLVMVSSKQNLQNGKFYCPKVGYVKIKLHRGMPSDFKSLQVVQKSGRWYVTFTCSKAPLNSGEAKSVLKSIGIDLNSKEYVISDGNRYAIPEYLKENQSKIKKLQRSLSRKKKGSNNYRKAQLKLCVLHDRISRQRHDFFHKLSKSLVDTYDIICLEDLDVNGIQRKYGSLIADNGFALFRHMVVYKSKLNGTRSVIIDRFYASSQVCSSCGYRQKMPLKKRVYDCKTCGLSVDRDSNSAINIMHEGKRCI